VVGTTLSAHELLIIAASGTGAPRILLGIYIPLIVVAAVCAATWMDATTRARSSKS
jgi:MFS transporter, NNP family, nitrate/nitrite transporter